MTSLPDRQTTGTIFSIQKYSVHDGPGIRTLVFCKGCHLACRWCSNPESQARHPQLAYNPEKCLGVDHCQRCRDICPKAALSPGDDGKMVRDAGACDDCLLCAEACPNRALSVYGYETSVDQVLKRVEEDDCFYARSGGGLTLSGGEPLLQADFALALLREARKRCVDTCMETCGHAPWQVLERAAPLLNQVLFDIKCADPKTHRAYTGVSNERILDNLVRLTAGFPELAVTVRTPVIPGVNDTEAEIGAIVDFIGKMPHIRYELLAYHRMGIPKYGYLGREYPMGNCEPLPDARFAALREFARDRLAAMTKEHR